MNESQISKKIITNLLKEGLIAYKVSDRFQTGIPDIYFGVGCWMETKLVRDKDTFRPWKLLSPGQRIWGKKLSDFRNSVYMFVAVQYGKDWYYWLDDFISIHPQTIVRVYDEDDNIYKNNLELCLSTIS